MQAYQFHVRQPQAHPMIPPPLLWFALNNMYTDNFTQLQLNEVATTLYGVVHDNFFSNFSLFLYIYI
jgi:hypothetical protein